MDFGVSLPNNYGVKDVQALLQLASTAEQLGFHAVWVSEHLFNVGYVLRRLGNKPYYEPLTILSAVAAGTQTIRLGTSVLVLPYHHPVRLAKTIATLDAISGGRVILGVGVGVIEAEFKALGSPFQARGAVTDESIAAMQALWTQEEPHFEGKHYAFSGMKFSPKPVQKPYPPIWVGGSSRVAIRRAAQVGDGWHPIRLTPEALRQALRGLHEQAAAYGRDPSHITISVRSELHISRTPGTSPAADPCTMCGTPEEIIGKIHAYAQAGVGNIIVSVNTADVKRIEETLAHFAQEVMPACVS